MGHNANGTIGDCVEEELERARADGIEPTPQECINALGDLIIDLEAAVSDGRISRDTMLGVCVATRDVLPRTLNAERFNAEEGWTLFRHVLTVKAVLVTIPESLAGPAGMGGLSRREAGGVMVDPDTAIRREVADLLAAIVGREEGLHRGGLPIVNEARRAADRLRAEVRRREAREGPRLRLVR